MSAAHEDDRGPLLRRLYDAFNARDVDAVLAALHPDVDWPNGFEGGREHGHAAVRAYWERQFAQVDPQVEPEAIRTDPDGRTVVWVHQVVRDHAGTLLVDGRVQHAYRFADDGRVTRMDVLEPAES